jgi:hypothetical protein
MGLAPQPRVPEKGTTVYERKYADGPTIEGPRRFEEGVASDTDVPNEFAIGANPPDINITHRKTPAETMRERAHVGSASWIEAPSMLRDFAAGAGEPPQEYGRVNRGEGRKVRVNPTTVEG